MIKSVIDNKEENKELPFPKLMISKDTGMVVSFEKSGRGSVVNKGSCTWCIGHISDAWFMPGFKDFHGSITLSNGE